MRLKSIKLAGFKSFVDPTTVHFPSNMSSVVGPNGCGKSNIIDAVRWVMGESSAKTLRGESMTDVIFNGTTNRQPVSQASIELIFDNGAGKIVGEYAAFSEISVRRVVDRDGGSHYFLNGAKCRRRDITDLFLGTGLGPRSYAIIEQGMISRLIESKPEELRVFIEEAAGISKYKERRRETENRMRRTLENLERLTDLRDELARQLQHLQRQAAAAEKYAELKAQERDLQAQLLALQWRALQSQRQDAQAHIDRQELEQEAERAKLIATNADIERLRSEHADHGDRLAQVQAQYYTVGGEVTRVEQALKFAKEKRATAEQDLLLARENLAAAQRDMTTDRERQAQWQDALKQLQPQLEELQAVEETASDALIASEQAMTDWQADWDNFNQRAAGPRQTSEVQQSRIVYLEQVLRKLQERISRVTAEVASGTGDPEADDVTAVDEQIALVNEQVVEHELAIESITESIQQQRHAMDDLRKAQDDQRSLLQQLKGRRASLQALQDAATANEEADALQTWLAEVSLTSGQPLLEGITVAEPWSAAVEQVLDAFLTGTCVPHLAQLTADAARELPRGANLINARPAMIAVPGTLSAHVQGPAPLQDWLSRVHTASDLAAARAALVSLPEGASVITPDGQWLGHGWLRTRSEANAETGVIERRRLLSELDSSIEQAEQQLAGIEAQLEEARGRRGELDGALTSEQQTLKSAVREQADLTAERKTRVAAIEQLAVRNAQLDRDLNEAREQFDAEQAAVLEARATLAEALDQMEADGSERESKLAERDRLRDALLQARSAAREARDASHQSDLQAQNLRTQLTAVDSAIERQQRQVSQLEQRIADLLSQVPAGDNPDEELEAQLEELLERRIVAEADLTEARTKVADIEQLMRAQEQAKSTYENTVARITSELEQDRLKQAERVVRAENLVSQVVSLERQMEQVVTTLPDDASEQLWQQNLEHVANRITRLGPINLAAIDECARASERKTYLDAQNEDLESALETLENAIRKIDRETRARFKETFDQVNAGFSDLFPRVFGGGMASLEMTGDDLLDTGVAIMARPPGKKNSTIHLLSGGEKAMTAIALVFSIFQLNPAPFCMLDEVDAPLDDANVGRYARMVKEMSEKVQFIFITHNKITMEVADQLLGVTMHEPGVSRLVTVNIAEAAQLAAS